MSSSIDFNDNTENSLFIKLLESNIDIEYIFNGIMSFDSRQILRDNLRIINLSDNNVENNYVTINKQKALIVAIITRSIDMVKFLLNCDVNINFEDNNGFTPLMLASMENNYYDSRISSSNELHHTVIVKDKNGFNPMIALNNLSRDDIIRVNNLYKFKFCITYDSKYESIFCRQTKYDVNTRRLELVKLLLEKNPNINYQNKKGYTALMYAIVSGHLEIAKLLLQKGSNINLQSKSCKTALVCALYNINKYTGIRKIKIVKLLLKNGANVNSKCKYGMCPLYFMTTKYRDKRNYEDYPVYFEIIKLLIKHGAFMNSYIKEVILLHSKKRHKNKYIEKNKYCYQLIQLAIDQGFNINYQDSCGINALMVATNCNKIEMVELLLKNNCNIGLQDKEGNTALIIATKNNSCSIIKTLISYY